MYQLLVARNISATIAISTHRVAHAGPTPYDNRGRKHQVSGAALRRRHGEASADNGSSEARSAGGGRSGGLPIRWVAWPTTDDLASSAAPDLG